MGLTTEQLQDIFVAKFEMLSLEQFEQIVRYTLQTKRPLEQVLMERAFITPHQYLDLLADYFGVESNELTINSLDADMLKNIPEEFATQNLVVAFDKTKDNLCVAVSNPKDEQIIKELKTRLGFSLDLKIYVSTEYALRRALLLYDGDFRNRLKNIANALDDDTKPVSEHSTESITSLVNAIVETGIIFEASDVHIEPDETETYIRFRIDGYLRTVASIPSKYHNSLIARLKVLASLKIDQKRVPQDGRFMVNFKGQDIDVRLSTVPSLWGEKPVMRLLPKEAHLFDINNLGLLDDDVKLVTEYMKRPHGMILVCGPTGSGKTTTLYACLQQIGSDRIDTVNISTIEDPIEYTMPRVTQIQIHPEIDLTFANGLRALLRQDPDIIMVGEIRDSETADFAVRAALVGRLVFSSLHTNDASGAIPRLLDMGVEPFIVSSTLTLVIAQRLTRKLCIFCRQSHVLEKDELEELRSLHGLDDALKKLKEIGRISDVKNDLRFFQAVGCAKCSNTGYRGRSGVYEILEVNNKIRSAINNQIDSAEITRLARENGMKTMFEDGLAKVIMGEIDLKELLKVAYS